MPAVKEVVEGELALAPSQARSKSATRSAIRCSAVGPDSPMPERNLTEKDDAIEQHGRSNFYFIFGPPQSACDKHLADHIAQLTTCTGPWEAWSAAPCMFFYRCVAVGGVNYTAGTGTAARRRPRGRRRRLTACPAPAAWSPRRRRKCCRPKRPSRLRRRVRTAGPVAHVGPARSQIVARSSPLSPPCWFGCGAPSGWPASSTGRAAIAEPRRSPRSSVLRPEEPGRSATQHSFGPGGSPTACLASAALAYRKRSRRRPTPLGRCSRQVAHGNV